MTTIVTLVNTVVINVRRSSYRVPVILSNVKLESSAQILVKLPNIKFHEKSPAGVEFFRADEQTDRQTDRHDEANIRSLQYFLRMRLKPKRKEIQQILIPKI